MESQKIKCKTVVLCGSTTVDEVTKLVTIHNVIDRIFVPVSAEEQVSAGVYKRVKIPLEVVVFWDRVGVESDEIHDSFKVHFIDPEGKALIDDIFAEVHLTKNLNRFYSIVKLDSIPCAHSGAHAFRIYNTAGSGKESEILCEENIFIQMVNEKGEPLQV